MIRLARKARFILDDCVNHYKAIRAEISEEKKTRKIFFFYLVAVIGVIGSFLFKNANAWLDKELLNEVIMLALLIIGLVVVAIYFFIGIIFPFSPPLDYSEPSKYFLEIPDTAEALYTKDFKSIYIENIKDLEKKIKTGQAILTLSHILTMIYWGAIIAIIVISVTYYVHFISH